MFTRTKSAPKPKSASNTKTGAPPKGKQKKAPPARIEVERQSSPEVPLFKAPKSSSTARSRPSDSASRTPSRQQLDVDDYEEPVSQTRYEPELKSDTEGEEEEFDALFDGSDSRKRRGNEFVQSRTFEWAVSRTMEYGYLAQQIAGTRFTPNYRTTLTSLDDSVAEFWHINTLLHDSDLGIFVDMIKDKKVWIHAPEWAESLKKSIDTTQDVNALQWLLMEKGADEAGPDSRDAEVVFIHCSEIRDSNSIRKLQKSKRMNRLRRGKSKMEDGSTAQTDPDTQFFVFGTIYTGSGSTRKTVPIFQPIWHLGLSITVRS